MKKRKTEKNTTVAGIVIPVKWDGQGRPRTVAISGFDEQEYLIEGGPASGRLLDLVKKSVTVVGDLSEDPVGKKWIFARKIQSVAG